jgi:Na+-driven multidrug efflux pump
MKRKFKDDEDERIYNAIVADSALSRTGLARASGTVGLWFISVVAALALLVIPAPLQPLVASESLSWNDFGIALFVLAAAVFAVLMAVCNLVLLTCRRWRDKAVATRRQ